MNSQDLLTKQVHDCCLEGGSCLVLIWKEIALHGSDLDLGPTCLGKVIWGQCCGPLALPPSQPSVLLYGALICAHSHLLLIYAVFHVGQELAGWPPLVGLEGGFVLW